MVLNLFIVIFFVVFCENFNNIFYMRLYGNSLISNQTYKYLFCIKKQTKSTKFPTFLLFQFKVFNIFIYKPFTRQKF